MKIRVEEFIKMLQKADPNSYVLFSPDEWYRELDTQQPFWRIDHREDGVSILVIALDDKVITEY